MGWSVVTAVFILIHLAACRQPGRANLPPPVQTPPTGEMTAALTRLQAADPPPQDRVAIAAAYRGNTAPRVAATTAPIYQVGDTATFWVKNFDDQSNQQVTAVLQFQTNDLLMWVQSDQQLDIDTLAAATTAIETTILPTNRAFFGEEWQPGVDGDPRLHILHVESVGIVATAYFDYANQYVTAVNPFSNQREMLTVGLETAPLGSDTYYSAIAHELQHLIQWRTDSNETGWLNEGMAELATLLNGYPIERGKDYVNQTDIQLTDLSQQPDVISAHYAASALFTTYFYDRFGAEATQALVANPLNGPAGMNATLADLGLSVTFDEIFADWLAANFLQAGGIAPAPFRYQSLTLPPLSPQRLRPPATIRDSVNQYGADYYRVTAENPVTAVFTGTRQVPLFPTTAYSGDHVWYSVPADESAVTLTRALDLTGVTQATLTFWTWYDLEAGWDYGYTAVSTDNGQTWTLLETTTTTRDNPQGNSLGPGYSGLSGNGETAAWVPQTTDLTPFTGQPVLLRFLVITDTAVHHTGLLIDDVAVPEIGFFDDMESGDNTWQAAGFTRTTAQIPQNFIVQMILIGQNEIEVQRIPLGDVQQGEWQLPLGETYPEAVIIISGAAPVTRETAVYELSLHQQE